MLVGFVNRGATMGTPGSLLYPPEPRTVPGSVGAQNIGTDLGQWMNVLERQRSGTVREGAM